MSSTSCAYKLLKCNQALFVTLDKLTKMKEEISLQDDQFSLDIISELEKAGEYIYKVEKILDMKFTDSQQEY